jgi:hypothetical protein
MRWALECAWELVLAAKFAKAPGQFIRSAPELLHLEAMFFHLAKQLGEPIHEVWPPKPRREILSEKRESKSGSKAQERARMPPRRKFPARVRTPRSRARRCEHERALPDDDRPALPGGVRGT